MKIDKMRYLILTVMAVIFAVLMCGVFGLNERLRIANFSFNVLIGLVVGFVALAVLQIVLTVKSREPRLKRVFFLLTAASAVGIPVFAVLHNVVYGLFFHGSDGDEAFFFILALIVCPVLFVIGSLGSVICGIRNFEKGNHQ